jgi:hypothetical protein
MISVVAFRFSGEYGNGRLDSVGTPNRDIVRYGKVGKKIL